MTEMQHALFNRGEHGGSLGEWSYDYERMGEIVVPSAQPTHPHA
jgi:hypothetical protein